MLNREENQKAVDGTSQAIPITVEGSCRKASIQGRVALGSGRQSEGEAWGHPGSWPVQRGCCNSLPCGGFHRLLGKGCQSDFDGIFLIFYFFNLKYYLIF